MIVLRRSVFGFPRWSLSTVLQHADDWPFTHTVALRVAGWSMFPTLMKGDRLSLGPADAIVAGDLLVYVSAEQLCCHRAVRQTWDGQWIVRGDAMTGHGQMLPPGALRGKVVRIHRGRYQFSPSSPPALHWAGTLYRWLDEVWNRVLQQARSGVRVWLNALMRRSLVRRTLVRLITIDPSRFPHTVEARLGPVILASLHRPSGTLTQRSWTGALRVDTLLLAHR